MQCFGCHVCGIPPVVFPKHGTWPQFKLRRWHTAGSLAYSLQASAAAMKGAEPAMPRQKHRVGGQAFIRGPSYLYAASGADGEAAVHALATGRSPTQAASSADRDSEGRSFGSREKGCVPEPALVEGMGVVGASKDAQGPGSVTRRAAVAWGAIAGSLSVSWGLLPPPSIAADTAAAAAVAGAAGQRRLKPELAAAITGSIYDAVIQQQLVDEQTFQADVFKLRAREWPYYLQANRDLLPALPDLSDLSGGLSNPAQFNFMTYILWKVAVRYVEGTSARAALTREAGRQLAGRIAEDALQIAASSPPTSESQAASTEIKAAVSSALQVLQDGGFLDSYSVTWGATPNLPGPEAPLPLRSEALGGEVFQVTLQEPADIKGSVSLRAEEDAFWGCTVSSLIQAVLDAGGRRGATVDEYFFQDKWQGPTSVRDQILLFLGDPLTTVEVPWEPTTLVQDWRL